MSNPSFIHLHNRSEFSLLSSALRINDIAKFAAGNGMSAVALTDRMNLHACMKFYDACMRNGVRPIIGSEIAVESFSRQISVDPLSPAVYDIVILAENNKGYEKLCELITRIQLESSERILYAKKEWIEELAGDWIILSGGFNSEIFQAFLNNNEISAREAAVNIAALAGAGKFYIELQWHQLKEEKIILPKMINLAKQINIPVVATNQCLYAEKEDAPALELLKNIKNGTQVNSISELTAKSNLFYFRDAETMNKIFKNAPEAIENTAVIANQCAVELHINRDFITPHFDCPEGQTSIHYIKYLCEKGLINRYPDWKDETIAATRKLTKQKRKAIDKRLKFELETIQKMGFINYFLIVADFVSFAKKNNIPVGPGRGSAAGSLVSYLLGITDVDPLDYGLLFERFLNPARKKMPDIDMDFCELRREEVINYVRRKYGDDKVAQITTFNTMRFKAAIRETGRILNTSAKNIEQICRLLTDFVRNHEHRKQRIISQALEKYHPLRELYLHDRSSKNLLDIAVKIEDLPKNLSIHAAGIVISPRPLRTIVPLSRGSGGDIITQFDMHAIERVGLLKMDFLGLSTLTIINDAVEIINQGRNIKIDLSTLPLDDKLTYQFLKQGDVTGVFQLESSTGMHRLVLELQPDKFDDLIAILALYRPGAMSERESYVKRRHGLEEVKYLHPKLKPILKETYGIMLYQEQVMQTLHSLAGYSLSDADIFRQIMSKKLSKRVEFERKKFISGAVKKEIPNTIAEELFDRIAQFAGYGFNKSHATAYAFIAFRTAWLKAHYPAEFFAALMNSRIDTPEKFQEYKAGCKVHNINILPPDLNKSKSKFSVEFNSDENIYAVRFGLAAVKNMGAAAAEAIITERELNGDYMNIDDFVRRINHKVVNKKAVESLIKSGAADCFNCPRQRMCVIADDAVASWERGGISEFQRSFFDTFDDNDNSRNNSRTNIDKITEWNLLTRLSFEKDALGIYLTGHPLDNYGSTWRSLITSDSRSMGYKSVGDSNNDFINSNTETKQLMGGLIIKTDWRVSKKQTVYGIVTFEDLYGTFEVILWSDLVEKYSDLLKNGEIWFVAGVIRTTFGKTTLSASNLFPVNAIEKQAKKLYIFVKDSEEAESKMKKFQDLVKKNTGSIPVELKIFSRNKKVSIIKLPESMFVSPSENFLHETENLFGESKVKIEV